jgi:hypothetical protein
MMLILLKLLSKLTNKIYNLSNLDQQDFKYILINKTVIIFNKIKEAT